MTFRIIYTSIFISDEGCPSATLCCSSEEDLEDLASKGLTVADKRVARSTSADSAVDLSLEEPSAKGPEEVQKPRRRMTLTVTDLPLRSALLPLAEPLALANCCDRPYDDLEGLGGCSSCLVPSKTLLEAQLIEFPIVPLDKEAIRSSASRRESSQSCLSDGTYNENNVRILRTPSVVVSDYSDDVVGGITLEEIEYFRRHRLGRRFSSDGKGVDYEDTDISAASSCSNLNYCGSHISILDGLEMNYGSGLKTPERKMSNSSTCSTLSGGEDDEQFCERLAQALDNEDMPIAPTVTKKKVSE